MYKRMLDLKQLTDTKTYFLFGPRATGKTSLIQTTLPDVQIFDLLDDDTYEALARRPKALGEQIVNRSRVIVIDEIQKLPKLLDEIHRLIETEKLHFLLTGSSARKLKRSGANMLGGRARGAEMFPLVYPEITDFDLLKYLNFGGLPLVYCSTEPMEDLKAYVRGYLSEEIKAEAAVRNYDRFVRFLETMALSNGQEINYAQLSSDSGVPARTIEGHIEILKDTLIGFELLPFEKTKKRKATTKSKFFFFDTGVANFLARKLPMTENHSDIGTSFEQFVIQEVRAYLSYFRKDKKLTYWRAKDCEVDLLIGSDCAIEIKFSEKVQDRHFTGLRALAEEKLIKQYFLVGRFEHSGVNEGIEYLHYQDFLKRLWNHQLIKD